MTELREQIYSIASALTNISADDVYYGEAPQDDDKTAVVDYPYLIFEILASPKDRDTGTQWRLANVQFDIFGQTAASVEDAAVELQADLENESNYSFSTEFSNLMDLFEDFKVGPFSVPSDDNKSLWQISIQYTYKLEEV